MKKLFLLLSIGSIGLAANAQVASHRSASSIQANTKLSGDAICEENTATGRHAQAKATAVTFYTQTFGGGLPATWSTGNLAGLGNWRYATAATTTPYTLGSLSSTTASNGWMLFNADSFYTLQPTVAHAGYLQTESINCSAHTTVRLNFQEKYRKFFDSTVVWVSTSPTFATYTRYAILPNATMATNDQTANPQDVHVNITSAAASQPSVYIRFIFYARAGGAYSWLIDDITLSELDPHDVSIDRSFLFNGSAAYGTSIYTTPLAFVDSVFPVTFLSNQGANIEANVPVTAQIFNGSTSVYSQSLTYNPLPLNAADSLIEFTTGFKPTATGNYTLALGATVPLDAVTANDKDTVLFSVTDTVYQINQGLTNGGVYVHRTSPALSIMQGTRFDIPASATRDTISGFSVGFHSLSAPTGTGEVSVQLYSIKSGAPNWTFLGTSKIKNLVASEISSTTSTVWAYFPIDAPNSGGIDAFIVDTNTSYAAVLQIKNVSTDLVVLTTPKPNATPYAGYFGQTDSSLNDGALGAFAPSTTQTGVSSVPLVRLHFGRPDMTAGVNNVNSSSISTVVSPNPASSEVNVSFSLLSSADVTVNLTNTVGQIVATKSLTGSLRGSATFNTATLPAGIYFYSVIANGERSTGRIAIVH